MSDELHTLEDAKAEALAAFAAIATIIDLAERPETARGISALREDALRHLSAALTIIDRGKAGKG